MNHKTCRLCEIYKIVKTKLAQNHDSDNDHHSLKFDRYEQRHIETRARMSSDQSDAPIFKVRTCLPITKDGVAVNNHVDDKVFLKLSEINYGWSSG